MMRTIAAVLTAVLLTAVPPELPPDQTWSLYLDEGSEFTMDAGGNLLDIPSRLEPVTDVLTGETVYYTVAEYERTEPAGDDEWAGASVASTLYTPEGEILAEREPYVFNAAVGGLVLRRATVGWFLPATDEEDCGLWDPYTGEVAADDAAAAYPMGADHAVLLDREFKILGVVDAAGEKTAGFPAEKRYSYYGSVGEDVIVYEAGEIPDDESEFPRDTYSILNDRLETVYEAPAGAFLREMTGAGGSALVTELGTDGGCKVLAAPDYHPVYETDRMLSYYDGTWIIEDEYDGEVYHESLYRADGTLVYGPADYVAVQRNGDITAPVEAFVMQSGSHVTVLSAQEEVLFDLDLPGLGYFEYADGFLTYNVESGAGDDYRLAFRMIDEEGRVVIGEEKEYDSITELTDADGARLKNRLWRCDYSVSRGRFYRTDLVDSTGKVVLSGARAVGTAGDGGVAVCKGPWIGLVDLDGNWIGKTSVYRAKLMD